MLLCLSLCVLLVNFQAAQKMQKEVIALLIGLDSSLTKVKDKNGRIPADLVPSNELEIIDMLEHEHIQLRAKYLNHFYLQGL